MQVVSHSLEVTEVRRTSVVMYQPSASSGDHPTPPFPSFTIVIASRASLLRFLPLYIVTTCHTSRPATQSASRLPLTRSRWHPYASISPPPTPTSSSTLLLSQTCSTTDQSGEMLNILPVNDPSNSTSFTTPTTTSVTVYHPSP